MFDPRSGTSPGEGKGWLPTPVFLLGESHGQRSLVGYSSWSHKESDTTEQPTLEDPVVKQDKFLTKLTFQGVKNTQVCSIYM